MYGVDPLTVVGIASSTVGAGTSVASTLGSRAHQDWMMRAQIQAAQRGEAFDRVQAQREFLAAQRSQTLSSALRPSTQLIIERQKQQTRIAMATIGVVLSLFWFATK